MRVLIIEDNENKYNDIKDTLNRVLESVTIGWCKSRNTGLVSIMKHNEEKKGGIFEPYDVIITDNIMPLYDDEKELAPYASSLVSEIRNRLKLKDLPIIVCSSEEVEECDCNYKVKYDSSVLLDDEFEEIFMDLCDSKNKKTKFSEGDFVILFLACLKNRGIDNVKIYEAMYVLSDFFGNHKYDPLFEDVFVVSRDERDFLDLENGFLYATAQGYLGSLDNKMSSREITIDNPLEVMNQYNYGYVDAMCSLVLNYLTRLNQNRFFMNAFGMDAKSYMYLDYDEQQKLIRQYHKEHTRMESDTVRMLIGSGEHSTFIKVKKGTRVMVGNGEHSTFVEAGLTPEEEKSRLEEKMDEIVYGKPIASVKKLIRKIKK